MPAAHSMYTLDSVKISAQASGIKLPVPLMFHIQRQLHACFVLKQQSTIDSLTLLMPPQQVF